MNQIPTSPHSFDSELFSYEQWRERFLKVVLRGASLLGFIAFILYLLTPSSAFYKALALLAYCMLLLVTFLPRLPYVIRAGIFLFLLFFVGFSTLIDRDIVDASVIFLGFMVMTGLLFSPKPVVYSLVGIITIAMIVGFSWQSSTVLDLARLTVIFTLVLTIIVTGLYTFQQEFSRTQQAVRQSLNSLRNERSSLEQRVDDRTAGLTRKTEQLRATSFIARKTAEVQDLSTLLNTVANLVTDQFGFYHTGIFLINETDEEAVLQAASSEGGRRMIERGHSLGVGTQGIVGHVAAEKKPRIALDVGMDAVFFNNPDLPMTRSELALPLLVRNQVLGILDIQSDRPQAFNNDDIDVLQTLADQVAIAIENARLLDESQATLAQLMALTAVRTRESWRQKLREKSRVFTYTPLGLRSEKISQPKAKTFTIPLTLRGQKIGSISIVRRNDAPLHKRDADLIAEVAAQAGLAIDNIRLLEEATQRANQEEVVGRLAGRFSQSLDTDTLLQTAARELAQLPDLSEVSVLIGKQNKEPSPLVKNNRRNTG